MIQALTSDLLHLQAAYERCELTFEALEAGRAHVLAEAERIRREIEEHNAR